jgi:hypothetical protein
MIENFFADYKHYIVVPEDEKKVVNEVIDPKDYAAYYILTLSMFDSRLTTWNDARKFEIDVEKSIKSVLRDFNQMQREKFQLQLLELDKSKNYFILVFLLKQNLNKGKKKTK